MVEKSLQAEYDLLQSAIRAMPEFVFVKDKDLKYVAASDGFSRVMGAKCAQDILGKTDRQILDDPEAAAEFERIDRDILASGENVLDQREEFYSQDARILYRSTSKYLIRDAQGEPAGILGKVRDITKEVIAEHRYKQEVQAVFEMMDSDCYAAIIDLNEWKLVASRVNPLYGQQLPVMSDLDAVLHKTLSSTLDGVEDARNFYSNFSFAYFSKLYRQGKDYFSFKYFHKLWNGACLWMKDTIRVRINPEDSHLMVLFSMQSIEELKQKEIELHRAAELDGLTGLLNRHYAKTLMEHILSNPTGTKVYSMFMVDIDNFKQVNDTYGHQTGDKVLIEVADALRECFRAEDLVCRLGGDEFVAFMPRSRETFTTPERAQEIIDRVKNKCIEGSDVKLTVSIGICDYPKDGTTLDELYSSADKALYEAKKRGKNQFYIYTA